MYCPNCYVLLDSNHCPYCGTKKTREPYEDDYCYLTEKESVWSDTLADIFESNGIPYYRKNVLGAGLTSRLGIGFERTRFYVPYAQYADARALEQEFFSEEPVEA